MRDTCNQDKDGGAAVSDYRNIETEKANVAQITFGSTKCSRIYRQITNAFHTALRRKTA
jgi:hypothetical protein